MILLLQLFGVFATFVFAVVFSGAILRALVRKSASSVRVSFILLTAAFWALGVWQAVTYWGGAV